MNILTLRPSLPNRTPILFLCGDVMTGRGIDQVMSHPSNLCLYEPYVESPLEYVVMAERANGPIPKPVNFDHVWGEAIEDFDCFAPAVRIINLETSITTSENYEPKRINYRMHPANICCLTAANIDCCVLANNHVLDWGNSGLTETVATLHRMGINTAGAGRNLDDALCPAIIEVGGDSRVLVFAVGTADSGIPRHWAATHARPGIALLPNLSLETADGIAERVHAVRRPRDKIVLSISLGRKLGLPGPTGATDLCPQASGSWGDRRHSRSFVAPSERYRDLQE